ncbi:UMP1-domain-containing protein [Sporormia fimetaria CBS 119925]|uniref:UMP1-domain-containing protein n=1 Tax=Sporormia fimetaria CBS 119925 TaxID=1340428 RepID=A0A6A6V4W6_9PLEO|nr:UMP1-domain-containing protein [Sporormia fimetaria CBS 119925]
MTYQIKAAATAALVYRAWSKKSLTTGGLVAALATAVVHSLHPWIAPFTLLAVFFLAGTIVTKAKHDRKALLTKAATGGTGGEGKRNHIQVFANSIVASALILLHTWHIYKNGSYNDKTCFRAGDVLMVGIVANYAAVAADTFSSELGILAKGKPVLITTPWREVPPGTNGGITTDGLAAGVHGAGLIAAVAALSLPFCADWAPFHKLRFAAGITVAGLCGTLLDSLLGALFQASVVEVRTGKIIEGDGGRKVLIHATGSPHLKNSAKVRSELSSHQEGKAAVAKSSGVDGVDAGNEAKKRMQEAGASGTELADSGERSRKVVVGRDIFDNNAVNVLTAALVSSLRFVPPTAHPTSTAPTTSAPSAPGLPDTLRSRLGLTSSPSDLTASTTTSAKPELQSAHPLEARLVQWRQTQDKLKMEMLRRQFGIAEPVRRGMELKITGTGEWRPQVLGGASGVHRDILEGRDTEIGWEDVFTGNEMRDMPDFHTEMEAKMKMNW